MRVFFPNECFNYTLQTAIVRIVLLRYKELKNPGLVFLLSLDCTMKRNAWDYFFPNLHVILNLRQILISLDPTPKP